jgi:hypothetical protein
VKLVGMKGSWRASATANGSPPATHSYNLVQLLLLEMDQLNWQTTNCAAAWSREGGLFPTGNDTLPSP